MVFPFNKPQSNHTRLVNSRYFKKAQKTRTRDFERNIPFKSRIKIPCQPRLPTLSSLPFPRIPTLASLGISGIT